MQYLEYLAFKDFVIAAKLQLLYSEDASAYTVIAVSASLSILCKIPKDGGANQTDFETNFKPLANVPLAPEVTTQFELNDKDLKICTMTGPVDSETGLVTLQMLVPGTPGTTDGRYIAGGEAFFDKAHVLDRVTKVQIIDIDNIAGYGANTVLKAYHDEEVPEDNQGWIVGVDYYNAEGNTGIIEVETLAGYGFIPAGFYLQVVGKKDPDHKTGSLFVNIFWGKKS